MRRLWLLIATACAATAGTVAQAGQPYLVSHRSPGEVLRLEDINGDGDALDAGEITLWAGGFAQPAEIAAQGATIHLVDAGLGSGNNRVLRLVDLNGDGDALDVGEKTTWVDGLTNPWGIDHDGLGSWFVADRSNFAVWRLVDVNGDGDALDVGEKTMFAQGIFDAFSVLFDAGGLFVSSFVNDVVHRVIDLNGDGDALDVGENLVVTPVIDSPGGLRRDSAGGLLVASINGDTLYRGRDKNSDGDFLDVGETLSYADNAFGGLNGPMGSVEYETGGFLLADFSDNQVVLVSDVTGDGDALDLGEVKLFADGFNLPVGLVRLVEDFNADFDHDGDVDGVDFLTWQRGYGLMGQTDNANGDANFDSVVNGGDLAVWETQYATPPPLAAAAAANAVPEPDSSALCLLAFVLIFSHRAHRVEYEVFPFSLRSL